jgi:hypothetical protein
MMWIYKSHTKIRYMYIYIYVHITYLIYINNVYVYVDAFVFVLYVIIVWIYTNIYNLTWYVFVFVSVFIYIYMYIYIYIYSFIHYYYKYAFSFMGSTWLSWSHSTAGPEWLAWVSLATPELGMAGRAISEPGPDCSAGELRGSSPRWRLIGFHPLDAPTSQITSRAVHPKSLLAPFATNDPTPGASDGAPGVWRKKLILSRSPGPPAIPQPHLDAMDLSIKRALTSWSMDDRYPMAQPPGDVSRSPAEARQWSCPGSGHPPNLPRSKGSQNREKYGNILYKWRFYDWKQD